jgi:transposase-like protein
MIDVEIGRTRTGARRFPVAFRIEFVRQWHDAIERGEKARLLREYNLTQATVDRWLRAYERDEYTSSMVSAAEKSEHKIGNRDRAELARLRQENAALKKKVTQSEAAQQILGKAFELLSGITESSIEQQDSIPPALMSATEYAQWLQRNYLS